MGTPVIFHVTNLFTQKNGSEQRQLSNFFFFLMSCFSLGLRLIFFQFLGTCDDQCTGSLPGFLNTEVENEFSVKRSSVSRKMGRVFFYCELDVFVIIVHGFQEFAWFILGFFSENIVNIPVVELRGLKSDYVVFELGH